MTGSTDPVI